MPVQLTFLRSAAGYVSLASSSKHCTGAMFIEPSLENAAVQCRPWICPPSNTSSEVLTLHGWGALSNAI